MDERFQIFKKVEFGSLELLFEDDKVYFPATECAKMLGYTNPRKAIRDHCPHGTKRSVGVQTGLQADGTKVMQNIELKYIPEGDLYRLIIRSKLPSVEKFEQWVFDEVLPTIRKYGVYATGSVLEQMTASPEFAIRLFEEIKAEQDKRKDIEKENRHNRGMLALMECKLSYYDKILTSKSSIPVSKIAKDYGMTAVSFNRMLHNIGIQYPLSDTWLLYSNYADQGYTQSYTYYVSDTKTVVHTHWTQKGRLFLCNFLKAKGLVPVSERMEEILCI